MKMAVFWDVVPCSLVEVYGHFRRSDDGGNKQLRNVGKLLSHYWATSGKTVILFPYLFHSFSVFISSFPYLFLSFSL
jgi:hypothetical protein